MNTALYTTTSMHLETWEDDLLRALWMGMQWSRVPTENLAFEPAVRAGLLRDNGAPHDAESLSAALSDAIRNRAS